MTSKIIAVFVLAFSNAFLLETVEDVFAKSSSDQFIYGKVTTIDGDIYTGQIRWGKEEAFWFDFFNSTKPKNENLKWLTKNEETALNKKDNVSKSLFGKWNNVSWSGSAGHSHIFACQFGDIKSIDIIHGDEVIVEFKDGSSYELDGGSNDIGTTVQVSDDELGVIKLDWKRIDRVDFMPTPKNMKSVFGEPLYGIVKTVRGEFEGFLQWDHDERLSDDILNGSSDDGELEIEFGKIKSIKRMHRGSKVTLKSGRSFELHGSNDVNSENRGIIVSTPNYGRVDIPWEEFEEMIIDDKIGMDQLGYNKYEGSKPIKGIVYTYEDGSYSGDIIFDLDEQYCLEMLDGKADDISYFFPFSVVKYIEPKNRKESLVRLANGESFILEDKVDVNEDNDGVLVFDGSKKPHYIEWSAIKNITFE